MQNEQQISLATSKMTYHSEKYSILQQKLASESKIKNICIVVIIAIVISNYIQVKQLRQNYTYSEDLIEEITKFIKEDRQNIAKEIEFRNGNITQMRTLFEKKIVDLEQKVTSSQKNRESEGTKLVTRMSKLQENLIKMRIDIQKHQDTQQASLPTLKQPRVIDPQQMKRHNAITQFLLHQVKEQYHESKTKWLKSMLNQKTLQDIKAKTAYLTALDNIQLKHHNVLTLAENKENQLALTKRLQAQYQFDKYPKELPFCIIVPTYNNAKNFRYEYNLQSILNLNYKNYKVIIVDDASTDGTYQLLTNFISTVQTDIRIHLIRNEMKMTAVPNINKAVREYCHQDDIAVLVDGDDQLLVRDSLKVFNSVYQSQKVDVAYSNHLKLYWHTSDVFYGWSSAYSKEQIKQNAYRDVPQKISHLRSFKVSLYLRIKESDLKDEYGSWFQSTYDQVICLPILQMSCGRIAFVDEYFYLYNFGIGTNDLMVDGKKQKDIANYVKNQKKRYTCSQHK